MAVYKYVLHHKDNQVPKWFLETLGVWVSALNACNYCVEHHFAGLKRLIRDDARADALLAALREGCIAKTPLDAKEQAALVYAEKLTRDPGAMQEGDVQSLRDAGWSDGDILEINQVTSYFGYANRTVLGLGCSTEGDIIGLSPNNNDDPDDWGHR